MTAKFEVKKYDANSFEFVPIQNNFDETFNHVIIFPKNILLSFRIYNPQFQKLVRIFFFASNTFRCDINNKKFVLKNLLIWSLGYEGFFEINDKKKLDKKSNFFESDGNFLIFKSTANKLMSIEGKRVKDFILDEKNYQGRIIYEKVENKTLAN